MSLLKDTIRAPYYPSIYYQEMRTVFGAVETDYPDLYTRPIDGKIILEIDTLQALVPLWGDSIFQCRELAYKLASGSCSESQFNKLLQSFYVKHKSFTDYVDKEVLFGDKDKTLLTRIINPARAAVKEYTESALRSIENSGGKVVMLTHDFIYATYRHNNLPEFQRCRKIKR